MRHRPDRLLPRLDETILSMRKALAARDWEAYGHADNAYHMAIIEESGNRYLKSAYSLGSAALEALRVRLQNGGNFRDRSFGEHVEMARLMRIGAIDQAADLMRTHILIINDSLDLLPLNAGEGGYHDWVPEHAEIFRRSSPGAEKASTSRRRGRRDDPGPGASGARVEATARSGVEDKG